MARTTLSKMQYRKLQNALKVKERSKHSEARIRKQLMENSHSDDFEQARTEWVYTGTFLFEEDFIEFNPQCELCHATGLGVNFVIANEENGNTLRVGSTCIQNFLRLGGAATQQESQAIFHKQVNESIMLPTLRHAYKECLKENPFKREVAEFSKLLKEYLEHKGQRYPGFMDNIDHIVEWLYEPGMKHRNLPFREQIVLRNLISNPQAIEVRTETLVKDRYKHATWQRKSRRVESTLAKSEAYETDRIARSNRH